MYKEMIISVILVILIFIGDFITQKYTKDTVSSLIDEFGKLKQSLINASKEDSEIEVNEIEQKWDKAHDKLAYYIEHDELEKVETNLTSCKSLAETENYDLAISELEKTVFVLNHITDKYAFNLENIF